MDQLSQKNPGGAPSSDPWIPENHLRELSNNDCSKSTQKRTCLVHSPRLSSATGWPHPLPQSQLKTRLKGKILACRE